MSAYALKYLRPAQYDSWLRKVDDPDWYEHRYRDSKDHAMASAIRELRDALSQRGELLEALKEIVDSGIVHISTDKRLEDTAVFSGDLYAFQEGFKKAVLAIAIAEGK